MGEASILSVDATNSRPALMQVLYLSEESIPAGEDSTSLIELELPAPNPAKYLSSPVTDFTGEAKVIDIAAIRISCASTDFDIKLLDKNDISLVDTIFEVYHSDGNELSLSEIFDRFIVKNRDDTSTNKLYLYLDNSDGVNDTGNIYIELIYKVLG